MNAMTCGDETDLGCTLLHIDSIYGAANTIMVDIHYTDHKS